MKDENLRELADAYLEAYASFDVRERSTYYPRNKAYARFCSAFYRVYKVSIHGFESAKDAALEIGGELP